MSWIITGTQKLDPDAAAYIDRVQVADTQSLEPAVITAINAFVVGCKADGIWNAIKASCILAGAKTLNGALVPLVGPAPTNVGPFVAANYDRKTGLVGNGSTKLLNSNRNNNADPQNSQHLSLYVSTANSQDVNRGYIGAGLVDAGTSHLFSSPSADRVGVRSRSGAVSSEVGVSAATGFIGKSRSSSTSVTARVGGLLNTFTSTSETPLNQNIVVFGRNLDAQSDARIAFYSIGESLDLAKLDARVTTLINAFAAAIP